MVNTVGNPLEEVIAANHLILGGVLTGIRSRMKIVHGGGFLPFPIGRLDHAWKRRPEIRRLDGRGAFRLSQPTVVRHGGV